MDKVINLKPDTKDEDIIAQKGNKKCIFYSDDVCRNGDRTRDCINCARVEYSNLYSLNWDNQEKLYSELKRARAEIEELKAECERLKEEQEQQRDYIVNYKNYKYEQEQKYRKALEDIRDIVETCLKFYKCEKCKFDKECQCDLEEYILTKINEVIGEK